MKALSMSVWSLLVIMMMGLTSCGDDDELQFSEEQLAYINKNKEYTGSFGKKMSGQQHPR